MSKICNNCSENKELDEFPIRSDAPDGHRNTCIKCRNEYFKELRKNPIVKEILAEGMKRCRGECGSIKPVKDFGPSKQNKDGLKSYCRACKRKESAKWNAQNTEYSRQYREEHRNETIEYNKIYRKENKETLEVKRKERFKSKTKEELEKIKSRKHEWYEENKDKAYANKTRRRARMLGVDENYGLVERKITMAAFDNKCFNCGINCDLCVDHHRPLVKGNALTLNNAVVLCKICNSSKFDKDPEEFYGIERCNELDKKLIEISEKGINSQENNNKGERNDRK